MNSFGLCIEHKIQVPFLVTRKTSISATNEQRKFMNSQKEMGVVREQNVNTLGVKREYTGGSTAMTVLFVVAFDMTSVI